MIADLRKYHRLFLLEAQAKLSIRLHPFLQTLVFMVPVVGKILFWKAVYRASDGDIGGFDMRDMVFYLIATAMVQDATWAYGGFIRDDICRGGLTMHLLRPASYFKTRFSEWSGNMVPRWGSVAILGLMLLLVFRNEVRLPSELWIYPAALVATLQTYLLKFVFSFCMSLLCFWTESSPPLIGHIGQLLGGSLVPLSFLPGVLQSVAGILPFQYMLYFPATVLMGKVSPAGFLEGLAVQALWIAAFGALARIMWRRGVPRYVAYGG